MLNFTNVSSITVVLSIIDLSSDSLEKTVQSISKSNVQELYFKFIMITIIDLYKDVVAGLNDTLQQAVHRESFYISILMLLL